MAKGSFMDANKVKCRDCGYLSVRDRGTGELMSPDNDYRQSGAVAMTMPHIAPFPICMRRACDFPKELNMKSERHAIYPKDAAVVLDKERDCEKFIPWQQGLSPKEHLEMDIIERREQREIDMIEKREQRDRQWRLADEKSQKDREERDRKWRQEDVKADTRRTKIEIVMGSVAIIAALIAGAISGPMAEWLFKKHERNAPPITMTPNNIPEPKPPADNRQK